MITAVGRYMGWDKELRYSHSHLYRLPILEVEAVSNDMWSLNMGAL